MLRGPFRVVLCAGSLCIALSVALQFGLACDVKPPSVDRPASADSVGRTYLLRYRFRVNQVVHYEVVQTATIKVVRGPVSQTNQHRSKEHKHFAVTAVDDQQNVLLEPMIDDVEMSARHNGQHKASYNSKRNKSPPKPFAGVAKTIGKPLVQLKISPTGRLIKAIPLLNKAVQKAVVKRAGPKIDPSDPSKNFLIVFPEKPVAVGEKWHDNNLNVPLQVDRSLNLWRDYPILRTYHLVSVEDGLATIELSMASMKPIKSPKLQVQMIQRLLNGTIVFDLKKGQIVSRKMTVDNKVFGFAGARSMLHVTTDRVERLVESRKTANRQTDRKAE